MLTSNVSAVQQVVKHAQVRLSAQKQSQDFICKEQNPRLALLSVKYALMRQIVFNWPIQSVLPSSRIQQELLFLQHVHRLVSLVHLQTQNFVFNAE